MSPRAVLMLLVLAALRTCVAHAQDAPATGDGVELRLHISPAEAGKHRATPAVLWLEPQAGTPAVPFPSGRHYTLLQKNRTFVPHLQVVPVGAVVQFPNADPFFHNVFSLFDGKRFDLGLYEAGSSKAVTFSREGVSYIFCNVHPEMSAVVLSISSQLYAIADANNSFAVHGIPPGEYKVSLWVEGVPKSSLDTFSRKVHVGGHSVDLGDWTVPVAGKEGTTHTNKFGRPYDPESKPPY